MLQANGCLVEISMEYCYGIIEADVHKLKDLFHIGEIEKTNVTRMWNMILSAATPTVCLQQKSENFQSRNVTLSMPSSSQKYM